MEIIKTELQKQFKARPELRKLNDEQIDALIEKAIANTELLIRYQENSGAKRINFEDASGIIRFVGKSGKIYRVHREIGAARYVKLLVFEKEFQFNRTLTELQKDHKELIGFLRKPDFVEAVTLAVRMEQAILNIGQERSFVFMMCALFCNVDGEDLSDVSLDMIDLKVADFSDYAASDLFLLVAIMFPSYLEPYNRLTQSIMEAPAIQDLV